MKNKEQILSLLRMPPPNTGMTIMNKLTIDYIKLNFQKVDLVNLNSKFLILNLFIFLLKNLNSKTVLYTSAPVNLFGFYIVVLINFVIRPRKIFLHIHNRSYNIFKSKKIVSRVLNQMNEIYLSKFLVDVPSKNYFIIPNTIRPDLEKYSCVNLDKRDSGKTLRILFLSNFIKSKGYLVLLQSLHLLSQKSNLNFTCDFIGAWNNKNDKNEFKTLVKKFDFSGKIRLLNKTSSAENISNIYINSDLLVLPTKYKHEAFPVVTIEALAFGLGILGTRVGGINEVIKEGKNGFFISANEEDICDKIIKFSRLNKKEVYKFSTKLYANKYSNKIYFDNFKKILFE